MCRIGKIVGGVGSKRVFGRILHHLVVHGLQQHSEVVALLTAKGQSAGSVDFIWFAGSLVRWFAG